jgi:hypothetical protein
MQAFSQLDSERPISEVVLELDLFLRMLAAAHSHVTTFYGIPVRKFPSHTHTHTHSLSHVHIHRTVAISLPPLSTMFQVACAYPYLCLCVCLCLCMHSSWNVCGLASHSWTRSMRSALSVSPMARSVHQASLPWSPFCSSGYGCSCCCCCCGAALSSLRVY